MGVMAGLRVADPQRGEVGDPGESGMDPHGERECRRRWMDGWMKGESSSNYRPCCAVAEMEEPLFQFCHSALTQQNEIFSH